MWSRVDVAVYRSDVPLLGMTGLHRARVAWILAGLLLVGGMGGSGAKTVFSPSNQQEPGIFVETVCPYADEIVAAFGGALICGALTAPMLNSDPDGGPIQLSVARIKSTSASPAAVPLVMLLGGPGQEVESILPMLAADGEQSYRPLLERQDVILLDQRGVGYSTPSLACPFDAVGGVRVPARSLDADNPVPAFTDCAVGLREAGINFEAFDSVQSAADVDLLRRALGYEQIDLLGTSYGSRLALTVVRDFPETVRSAILESPQPLQANLVAGQIIGFDRALSRVFADCEREEPCRTRYPGLEAAFLDAVENLNVSPLEVPVTSSPTGVGEPIRVDGTSFTAMVYLATYSGPLLPFVPALIDGIRTGENVVLENIAPYILGATAGVSLGASYVINCNDELGFTDADEVQALVAEAGVRPQIADGRFAGALQTFDICATFEVSPAEPTENQPVQSDVHVLILSGAFDPITPPSYADMALETLSNGIGVTFANGSHAPLSSSGTCGFGVVFAFLENPGAVPDVSCAAQTQVDFLILPQ